MRMTFIKLLWSIPFIRRRFCILNAVAWTVDGKENPFHPADHTCYYCGACHTEAELAAHFNGDRVQ